MIEELTMMVPALKPLVNPKTGEETKRTVELWLPEKKIRAWNVRHALKPKPDCRSLTSGSRAVGDARGNCLGP